MNYKIVFLKPSKNKWHLIRVTLQRSKSHFSQPQINVSLT